MLNRIKYILIAAIVSASLIKPALAAHDSTISFIAINDKVYEDVELLVSDSAQILVPFKQLADIFEIKYTANRVDKLITFTTYDGLNGELNTKGVFIDGQKISSSTPIFIQQGIMDNVINEPYIKPEVADRIFGVKITPDYSSLTVSAQVDRKIGILTSSEKALYDEKAPKALQDVALPKKGKVITLKKIGLQSNMINTDMTTRYRHYSSSNDNYSGNTRLSIMGDAYSGKYRAEANAFHYDGDSFLFGGLSATYMNNFTDKKTGNKYYYEVGKVRGFRDRDVAVGTNIFGAQVWNYDYDKTPVKDLSGYVKPTSLVRVTINDNEPVTLSTYAGYYTLKDMNLPSEVRTFKIEEINEDGTIEVVKEERRSIYGKDTPLALESQSSVYAGVWGYQNRLFREGANVYRGQNKKVTVGAEHKYGIKDNITFNAKVTADNIYEKNQSSVYYHIPTNDSLLVTGTQKNVNYQEGATALSSVEYIHKKDKNFRLRGMGGTSVARDIREDSTKAGWSIKGTAEYSKDLEKYSWKRLRPRNASIKLDGYHSSPDFYIASSDATSRPDRSGGRVQGSVAFNSTSVSGGYNKYYSNTTHRYEGGTIGFDEYNISANSKIPYVGTARFNIFHRRGSNELGRNRNYNYDAGLTRALWRGSVLQAGHRQSVYDTDYKEETSMNRDYYSRYMDTYIDVSTPIPKNLGAFRLGHNFVNYKTSGYKNDYNMFRFGYTFPTWKRVTLGVGWGFRYCGQGGHDFNVNMGYRAKSGQMLNIGYQYSKNGGYFLDNMFMPTTNRHSVNFIFNDTYQLFNHGLRSVGSEFDDKGIFEAVVFIDANKNGKYDKKIDIPVKDIPIVTSWTNVPEYTNRAGKISSATLASGIYNISLDMNSLPITVAPLTNDYVSKTVKIENGLTTKIELPLVSTVGSVSGVLKISDDFQRDLKITDFVVIVTDEEGNEVNYSTVTSSGEFYISGLAPGKYTLKLDDRYVDAYGLEKLQNLSERNIYIPFDYENPTDVVNQNLEYKTLSL